MVAAAAAMNGPARPRSVKMVDMSQDHIIDQPTSVNCEKDVKCWRSLSSMLASLLVPCCCVCKLQLEPKVSSTSSPSASSDSFNSSSDSAAVPSSTMKRSPLVVGTIFGHRKGKVIMSIQEDARDPPVMLLELAMPTFLLVKEMSSGLLRIAMECEKRDVDFSKSGSGGAAARHLYSEPVWTMYCNGRRVGFAVRRSFSEADRTVLGMMQSVSMGAGVIPVRSSSADSPDDMELDELMYMRATYERVVGSSDSESFHMVNPDGSAGQELSIFLLRA